jgi:hypothetical protein
MVFRAAISVRDVMTVTVFRASCFIGHICYVDFPLALELTNA